MDRKTVEQVRLALFGRMVMGVAHDVDNHLSVILGFSELLQITGGTEKKMRDSASKIFAAGEKVGAIIKQFSSYVRPHDPVPEPFQPAEILNEILLFSKYDLGRGRVALEYPASVPAGLIAADRRDFALALLALLFNGAEAMQEKGGTLRLRVSRDEGGWAFAVSDEGPGIPPDVLPRIFEEGFTTKAGNIHLGMGLPVARHLAEAMGGAVTVENNPSLGCTAVLKARGR